MFDTVAQNGNGLISDGSLRQVRVPLEELLNDLRLMRKFEIAGQQHDVAVGLYLAQVDETFERYSANSLIDMRDHARLLNVVAVDAAGNPLATITENGITRYGSEFANGEGESLTQALYFSDEWQINDQWRIDLGARYEKVRSRRPRRALREPSTSAWPGIADDNVLTGTGVFDRFDTRLRRLRLDDGRELAVHRAIGRVRALHLDVPFAQRRRLHHQRDRDAGDPHHGLHRGGLQVASRAWSLYATAFQTNYDSFRFGDRSSRAGNLRPAHVFTDTETLGVEVEGTCTHRLARRRLQRHVAGRGVRRFRADAARQWCSRCVIDFTGNQLLRVPEVSYRVTPAIKLGRCGAVRGRLPVLRRSLFRRGQPVGAAHVRRAEREPALVAVGNA